MSGIGHKQAAIACYNRWVMKLIAFVAVLIFCTGVSAQSDLQRMYDSELLFSSLAQQKGMKPAFLEFLTEDAVIFTPTAANGRDYWQLQTGETKSKLTRTPLHADIASSGIVGYTTGVYKLLPNGDGDPNPVFGQYATVWRRLPDGNYRAVIDITVRNNESIPPSNVRSGPAISGRDSNERGWSAADSSMNFLKMSMGRSGLSGAYKKFAGSDIRLLRENLPPITGKETAVAETKQFRSIGYPPKIAMTETGDMAYVWNVCEFADNAEERAVGNCLHVWKLRNKKWYIVLGVISAIPVQKAPTLLNRTVSKNND
jgi:ketosteroid isomerase-like protein